MAYHPYLDILRTEGAWLPHIVSLCNPIYPVINVHVIPISITWGTQKKKQFITPLLPLWHRSGGLLAEKG